MLLSSSDTRCEKFEACHDWVVGCGDMHNSRHARTCIKNRFCGPHCRMHFEDMKFMIKEVGGGRVDAPYFPLKIGDKEFTVLRTVQYCDPKYPDVSEDIWRMLMKREDKPGLTSSRIAKELKKQNLLESSLDKGEAIKTVIRGIRKLGKSVTRSKNGRGVYVFSFSKEGFKAEIENTAELLDEIEMRVEQGEDALEVMGEQISILKARERQEDHIWP